MSRKYICNYRKLKVIVLFLEEHIHKFLRRVKKNNIKLRKFNKEKYRLNN